MSETRAGGREGVLEVSVLLLDVLLEAGLGAGDFGLRAGEGKVGGRADAGVADEREEDEGGGGEEEGLAG